MKVVLDTNVIVSGFLNPFGPPGALVQHAAEGSLTLCYDARILAEYREVLLRPKFDLSARAVDDFLAQVHGEGNLVVGRPLSARLPDPEDEPFLEIAIAGNAQCLVTGNIKHFPPSLRQGIKVLTPAQRLELMRAR